MTFIEQRRLRTSEKKSTWVRIIWVLSVRKTVLQGLSDISDM
jgi:hypothetical protein